MKVFFAPFLTCPPFLLSNILAPKNKYKEYIHSEEDKNEDKNFKMINSYFYETMDYDMYLIINELYHHTGTNVFYYQKYIHNQLFYDEQDSFIIKRKQLFQEMQQFNLSIYKLKHVINIHYQTAKNNYNLFGDQFKEKHIELIEHGSKYKFDYFEMYNIVDSSFKQLCEGDPVILNIKNPYTNQSFSYFNIINIYFLMMRHERIPKYFYLYFQSNFSKKEIYNKYHLSLFVDIMHSRYTHFTADTKIKYIDKMLKYHNYNSFIRKSREFKLDYLESIGSLFFLGLKIMNHYGNHYTDYYSNYFQDSLKKLNYLRISNPLSSSYGIRVK